MIRSAPDCHNAEKKRGKVTLCQRGRRDLPHPCSAHGAPRRWQRAAWPQRHQCRGPEALLLTNDTGTVHFAENDHTATISLYNPHL